MNPARHTRVARDALELRDEGALEELARGEGTVIDRHRVGMPGRRRAREPACVRRLEMTTAMAARRRPPTDASMSAWRLLPRPETSTPIAGGWLTVQRV